VSPFTTPMDHDDRYRVYAITMKHKIITGCFLVAIILQLGLGGFMTYLAAKNPGTYRSLRVHPGSTSMWAWLHF